MKKPWLLPLANLLCLIHCVGLSLLSIFAPLLLTHLHLEWLEWSVLAFNLTFGTWLLKSQNLKSEKVVFSGFYLLILISCIGLIQELHMVYHGGIILMALLQTIVLIQVHKRKSHHCCDHKEHS